MGFDILGMVDFSHDYTALALCMGLLFVLVDAR